MITHLTSPTICLIDDEQEDYEPILNALLRLGLGCVHVKGDSASNLPPQPFKGLRVVFTDLHLSTHVGKDAASHTANVFSRVVSSETAPVIVVIWSKYKDDISATDPNDDQLTEAELFKSTLLESFPAFKERLIFIAMEKPKPGNRPTRSKWVKHLQKEITNELTQLSAVDALWSWESMIHDAGMGVTADLTTLVLETDLEKQNGEIKTQSFSEQLKLLFKILVRSQGGPHCTAKSAPLHLAVVLGQCLIDYLEHMGGKTSLSKHGPWLIDNSTLPTTSALAPGINGFLLTAAHSTDSTPFAPGTVYRTTETKWSELFGVSFEKVRDDLYAGKSGKFSEWKAHHPKPVLIELSPACDVHQNVRQSSLLIGGLIFPEAAKGSIKRADAIEPLPSFALRWPAQILSRRMPFSSSLAAIESLDP